MPTDRTYDIVLLGATGFTGGLVAEHLARRLAGSGARWAIAGRSIDKLDAVRDRVATVGQEPAVETVDVHDLVGLLHLAEQTRVLATTVGPYVEHGELVVQACIRSGTDYCDITGEPAFVDRIIDRYDGDAREQGVRVVPCCGFDSIPHDLGVRFTVAQLPSDQPITVRGYVRAKGLPSGGTWNSAVKAIGETDLRSMVGGSGSGSRGSSTGRRARGLPLRIQRASELGAWGVPLPTIDPAVVLRSARALDAYGPDFRYGHYAHVEQAATVAGMVGGAGLLMGLAKVGPTRDLLLQAAPVRRGTVRGPARVRLVPVHLPRRGGRRPARHHPRVRRRPRLHRDRRHAGRDRTVAGPGRRPARGRGRAHHGPGLRGRGAAAPPRGPGHALRGPRPQLTARAWELGSVPVSVPRGACPPLGRTILDSSPESAAPSGALDPVPVAERPPEHVQAVGEVVGGAQRRGTRVA